MLTMKITNQNVSLVSRLELALLTVITGPLIGLVRRGNHEAVKLLVELGADVHDPDVRTSI